VNEVAELLDRLSGPSKYAFEQAVRHTCIDGCIIVIGGVFLGCIAIYLIMTIRKKLNEWDFEPLMLLGLGAFLLSLVSFIMIGQGSVSLLEPEGQTIKDILGGARR